MNSKKYELFFTFALICLFCDHSKVKSQDLLPELLVFIQELLCLDISYCLDFEKTDT